MDSVYNYFSGVCLISIFSPFCVGCIKCEMYKYQLVICDVGEMYYIGLTGTTSIQCWDVPSGLG
jgi:hypothetical protein